LTWQPRRIRLFPGAGGVCSLCGATNATLVREIFYKPGESLPKGQTWTDPMVAYRATEYGLFPIQAQGTRPLWTDLARLALPVSGVQPAAIITQSYRLARETDVQPGPDVSYVRTEPGQDKVYEWGAARLPYTRRIAGDPELVELVRAGLETAEDAAKMVGDAVRQVVHHRADVAPFWAPLARRASDFVLALEGGADRLAAREAWYGAIRESALDAFRLLAEARAGRGDGMKDFVRARVFLRRALGKLLPLEEGVASAESGP
jgi:hypothetical protein